jgi:hypothetical protein
MCNALYAYEISIGRTNPVIRDPLVTTEAMLSIMGLCKGDYEKVEIVGKKVG